MLTDTAEHLLYAGTVLNMKLVSLRQELEAGREAGVAQAGSLRRRARKCTSGSRQFVPAKAAKMHKART